MSAPLRAAGRCLRRLALERSSGARSVLGTETDKAFAGLLCGGGSDFQGRHSATGVSRRTFESEAYAWDHEHRPYLSRREREIISAYHHPSREYLKLWEGDETLRGTLSEEAEARGGEAPGAIADQGKLVDRIVPVVNRSLETVGELALPGLIYDQPLRKDIVHRVVVWQRANWRQGTVKVKTRSEVRGGGRKPWQQKGTGRARAGSIRSPLWRGGGKAHGPRPKDWSQSLNSKVRRLGLRIALSSKLAAGQLTVVDALKIESAQPRTKELTTFLENFQSDRMSFLLVDDANGPRWEDYAPVDASTGLRKSHWQWRANLLRQQTKEAKAENECKDFVKLQRSAANLGKRVKVVPPEGVNVYDLLAFDNVVVTPRAVKAITYRLSHPMPRFY